MPQDSLDDRAHWGIVFFKFTSVFNILILLLLYKSVYQNILFNVFFPSLSFFFNSNVQLGHFRLYKFITYIDKKKKKTTNVGLILVIISLIGLVLFILGVLPDMIIIFFCRLERRVSVETK